MQTPQYKMGSRTFKMGNKVLPYSTGKSTQCYTAAWTGGSLGENGYMYMYG